VPWSHLLTVKESAQSVLALVDAANKCAASLTPSPYANSINWLCAPRKTQACAKHTTLHTDMLIPRENPPEVHNTYQPPTHLKGKSTSSSFLTPQNSSKLQPAAHSQQVKRTRINVELLGHLDLRSPLNPLVTPKLVTPNLPPEPQSILQCI